MPLMQYLELVVVLVLVEVIICEFTLLQCPELVVVLVLVAKAALPRQHYDLGPLGPWIRGPTTSSIFPILLHTHHEHSSDFIPALVFQVIGQFCP